MTKKKTANGVNVLKLFLIVFFCMTVLGPLFSMLGQIQWQTVAKEVFTSQFFEIALNSLKVSCATTILSILLAYIVALAVNRSRLRGKRIIYIIAILPMLVPSVSHGMGLINLFGDNGLITSFFGLSVHLHGFIGILLGSLMYSFPVAFLMISDAMKYADGSMYEAADILGVPKINQFFSMTLPYMRRPLISAVFAVFTMVFTDYGVPLAVGGRYLTLPLYLYREVIGLYDYSKGAFVGLLLLIPALIAFLMDLRKNNEDNLNAVPKQYTVRKNLFRDAVLAVFTGFIMVFILMVLLTFLILTFVNSYPYDLTLTAKHIVTVFERGVGDYISNSFIIAFLAAVIGTIVGFVTAYLTARTPYRFSTRMLHLFALTSVAIPGIVLGLGYTIFFKTTFIYGTIMILVFVNVIHFFASPYLMMYNAMKKLNENYEDVGRTLDIPMWAMIKDVFIPNLLDTIAEMFGYFFVNCMITISAVAFLYSSATKPLAIMINEYESSMAFEAAAFVSLIILIANIIMKLLIGMVKKYCKAQYSR
ncbi:MAG: ABC transporter permease subunit [Eubacteriales bacterium]|nr:ABC transporter permease subunit [Eubacteriales bacterium]